jgi:catalase (peroxidase I)
VRRYAADEDAFAQDFAKAFGKLLALGVPSAAIPSELASEF